MEGFLNQKNSSTYEFLFFFKTGITRSSKKSILFVNVCFKAFFQFPLLTFQFPV